MRDYLINYLDGCFDFDKVRTSAFKRECKKHFPQNEQVSLYRALRKNYNSSLSSITSSHPNLISCSDNPMCAVSAAYGFGKELIEYDEHKFDKIVLIKLTPVIPLLTHQQIKHIVLPTNGSKYLRKRTLAEREFLVSYDKKVSFTVVNEYSLEEAAKINDTVVSIYTSISQDKVD